MTPTPLTDTPQPPPTPRTDWVRNSYQEEHEGCLDRGYGGQYGEDGVLYYYFLDLPPEPHTEEVVRAAIAGHICLAGKPSWAPDKKLGLAQGQYLVTELKYWHPKIKHPDVMGDALWSSSSATGTRGNRIRINLLDLSDEAGIRERMAAPGIPQDVVIFGQGAPLFRGPGP